MGNLSATRLFDRFFGFLLRPSVRRARRWSFVVTIPVGLALAHWSGLRPSLAGGLLVVAALSVLDVLVLGSVLALGARLVGRERRDALLDLLMHPVARRAIAGELRVFGVYPRALLRRARRGTALRFSYHRGSTSLGLAIAFLPALAAEATVVHLLLPADWLTVKLVALGVHLYAAVMLLGLALGERVHPHELDGETLELRCGTLYRASIPLRSIVSAERRRERCGRESGLLLDGDAGRLVSGFRTDIALTLREPLWIERPIGDPVEVTRLAFAVDDPAGLQAALASQKPARRRAHRRRPWGPAADALQLVGT